MDQEPKIQNPNPEPRKILYPTKYFDVIEEDGFVGIKPKNLNVIVFPYLAGEEGLPEQLIVIEEPNPLRRGGKTTTLVTGDAEGEDPDVLATAQRELAEETGYDITDPNRWTYLGIVTTNKMVEQEQPAFAVNCTGIDPIPPEGDGSKMEERTNVNVIPIKQALDSDCIYIPGLFVRVFKYVLGIDFNK